MKTRIKEPEVVPDPADSTIKSTGRLSVPGMGPRMSSVTGGKGGKARLTSKASLNPYATGPR